MRHSPAAGKLGVMNPQHFPTARSRRDFLFRAGGGLGGIALSWVLAREARGDKPPGSLVRATTVKQSVTHSRSFFPVVSGANRITTMPRA